jgi:hypothetical protein
MHMNKLTKILTASALALAVAPAFAQAPVATLQVERGTVMTSEGGQFQTAGTGTALDAGERIMLAENSAAVVRYQNGCVRRYNAPGVYEVPAFCTPVAARGAGQVDWASAGIITGIFLAGAAILSQMDDVDFVPPPPPPVSP